MLFNHSRTTARHRNYDKPYNITTLIRRTIVDLAVIHITKSHLTEITIHVRPMDIFYFRVQTTIVHVIVKVSVAETTPPSNNMNTKSPHWKTTCGLI